MVALRTLQERVRKSALRLDSEVEHWERKVSIHTLNMRSINLCVAGQLNLQQVEFDCQLGFDVDVADYTNLSQSDINARFGILHRLWVKQIRKRRKADYAKRKAAKILSAKGNTKKLKAAVSGRDFPTLEFSR